MEGADTVRCSHGLFLPGLDQHAAIMNKDWRRGSGQGAADHHGSCRNVDGASRLPSRYPSKIPLVTEIGKSVDIGYPNWARRHSNRIRESANQLPSHGYVAFINAEIRGAAMVSRVSEQVTVRERCAGCVKPVRLLHASVQYSAPHPARAR